MNFDLGPDAEAFRSAVREFLASLPPDTADRIHRTGTLHDWDVHRAMAKGGWLSAAWPAEMGGQERDHFEMAVMGEEFSRAGVPIEGWMISELVAKTLLVVGSAQQRLEVIPSILSGETLVCLGYSEPDAGSDVASVRTRAVRDGDQWVISGQKMFTTMAHEAEYVFLLARSTPGSVKHRGLTMFLVPLQSEGVEIHPIHTLGGERTNVTYYNDVRIASSAVVGEVDRGWDVMMVALAFERQPAAVGHLDRILAQAWSWAEAESADGDGSDAPVDRPEVRTRLGKALVDLEVGRLLGYRLTWMTSRGELPSVEGSMAKLFSSEALGRAARSFSEMTGSAGALGGDDEHAPAGGWIERELRHSVVTTIYAGTSEIQRGIIAEHGLSLPRTRVSGGGS